MEGGLDAQVIYDPPNLTYPYGAYIAVVDIDPETARVKVRRFIAVDDCGVRINPMIVDGQIHGGLAEGIGIALMEVITFDEEGNCLNGSFMDYLIPTALECPDFELGETVTPVPAPSARRQGRRRVAERRLAAGDRQRGHRRAARDPRRRPHRHAVHAGARVGGDAGTARAAAMISGALSRSARRSWPRSGAPFVTATVVRVAAPDERAARERRARARRRDDRGVRRRRVRAAQRAAVLAQGDRARASRCCCGSCPTRPGRRRATRRRRTPTPARRSPTRRAVTVQNPCLSGGAIEVFLEPFLPAPRVIVAGDTPIAAALQRLGPELGLDVDRRAEGADGGRRCRRPSDLALVVAAHGRDELAILRAALEAGVPYVGLVASRKRGAGGARRAARRRGRRGAAGRIDTPAGLDIGARTPAEIALSILARIVEVRRQSARRRYAAAAAAHRPPRSTRSAA